MMYICVNFVFIFNKSKFIDFIYTLLFVSINIINIIQGIIIINLPFYEIRCLSSLYFVYLIYKGDFLLN